MARWQTKSSKVVYENPWIIVHEDQVVRPDGKDGLYGYIEAKSESVYVVPVDQDGNTYIIQQERYTIGSNTWECVAGHIDSDSLDVAARRELLEETGLEAGRLTQIGRINPSNGLSTFTSSIWLAQDIKKVSDNLDKTDGILQAKQVPLSSIKQMVMDGELTCPESISAFFMAMTYLEENK